MLSVVSSDILPISTGSVPEIELRARGKSIGVLLYNIGIYFIISVFAFADSRPRDRAARERGKSIGVCFLLDRAIACANAAPTIARKIDWCLLLLDANRFALL